MSTNHSEVKPILTIDPSALEFYFEAMIPEVSEDIRAKMSRAIRQSFDKDVRLGTDHSEELREHISKKMGWWSPDGFDAYPERTEDVLQLIAEARLNEARYWEYNIIPAVRNKQLNHDVEKRIAALTTEQEETE